MLILQYQGRNSDYAKNTITKTYTYVTDNVAEIDTYIQANKQYLDVYVDDPEGARLKLSSMKKSQADGPFWNLQVEYRWEKSDSSAGSVIDNPEDTAFGQKSATLRSVLINIPISQVPDYRFNWDHYLICKIQGNSEDLPVPEFWKTDKTGLKLYEDVTNIDNYRWISDISQIPQPVILQSSSNSSDEEETVAQTIRWKILKQPVKPGVTSCDRVHYSITEGTKCTSRAVAGTEIQGKINKVGAPSYDFGLTGDDNAYDWKCDDANVQWTGEYWLATLTWTSSIKSTGNIVDENGNINEGEIMGWDPNLYERIN